MPSTKISDIIVPEVFTDYLNQRTNELSALRQSGVVSSDPVIQARVNGGGQFVNLPFFNDLTGDDEVLVDSAPLTVNAITAGQDVAVKLFRGKAWGANDLAGWMAGSDPMQAIADRVADYWVRKEQAVLISSLTGVFATALAASHVLDVTLAATPLNGDVILDGKQLLGDAAGKLTAIAMHSAKYTALQKQNLIDYMRDEDANTEYATYMGFRVVVDDACPVAAGNYTSYLFGAGAVANADMAIDNAVETDRDILAGEDVLVSRRAFIMHPRGIAYGGAANPANATLATGANWTKVYEDKSLRIVKLLTK